MEVRIVKDLEEVKEAKEVKDVKENARAAQWRGCSKCLNGLWEDAGNGGIEQ